MAEIDPRTGKVLKRSTSFMGTNTIFRSKDNPYMTRYWFGRLRLHIFHRGDDDQDPHDHPWGFSTFPFQSYVEEVTELVGHDPSKPVMTPIYAKRLQVVPAWRWNKRPGEHLHRVLGLYTGQVMSAFTKTLVPCDARRANELDPEVYQIQWEPLDGKKLVTIVIRTGFFRRWGFLKNREGKWCWIDFKEYIASGGSEGPCE